MKYGKDRTWAEVSLDNLAYNFKSLSSLIGDNCSLMAVVKGNAYGHGAVSVSKKLEDLGCRHFGTATIEEAMELRENGIFSHILILSPIAKEHINIAIDNKLIISVSDYSHAEVVSSVASYLGKNIEVHLMIDTGMCRYGMAVYKDMNGCIDEAVKINSLPSINLTGVFTHFAAGGDKSEDSFTKNQLAFYKSFIDGVEKKGLKLIHHCGNSPVTLRFPEAHYDMVRVGTVLYGLVPQGCSADVNPIMELKSKINYIKDIDAGDTVGYNRMFRAVKSTRIAIIPFGFVDGIHRRATNKVEMLLHGQRVRTIGKICMDLCFLDITGIPNVKIGDVVTIFGSEGLCCVSPYEITSTYPGSAPELIAMLGNRIPRFYI